MGSKVELACVTAEEFSLVYYKSMDKSRHALGRLYTDSALLSWCGHGHLGPDRIQSFLLSLPPTEFTVSTLDAHPLADDTLPSSNQGTFLVQVYTVYSIVVCISV